jgi:hypothetical protein
MSPLPSGMESSEFVPAVFHTTLQVSSSDATPAAHTPAAVTTAANPSFMFADGMVKSFSAARAAPGNISAKNITASIRITSAFLRL